MPKATFERRKNSRRLSLDEGTRLARVARIWDLALLDRTLSCFRIGDPNGAYPIFEVTGSTLSAYQVDTTGQLPQP